MFPYSPWLLGTALAAVTVFIMVTAGFLLYSRGSSALEAELQMLSKLLGCDIVTKQLIKIGNSVWVQGLWDSLFANESLLTTKRYQGWKGYTSGARANDFSVISSNHAL